MWALVHRGDQNPPTTSTPTPGAGGNQRPGGRDRVRGRRHPACPPTRPDGGGCTTTGDDDPVERPPPRGPTPLGPPAASPPRQPDNQPAFAPRPGCQPASPT